MAKKYEFIEHSGDLGLRAYGSSRKDVFANAAKALFEVLVVAETIEQRLEKVVHVEADALDELMVSWLSELLFLFDSEGLLLNKFDIKSIEDHKLEAIVRGETLDLERHEIKTEIKAVTYHKLYVKKVNTTWESQVILDL